MTARTPNEVGRDARGRRSAFFSPSAQIVFWGLGAAFLALDLWSKHWAFSELGVNEVRPLIAGAIDLRRSLNDGAVFGSLPGYSGLFVFASIAALAVVVYMFAHSGRSQRALHVALALVLAGATGNLYDRTFIKADVVKYTDAEGRRASIIGTNLSGPEEDEIHVVDWPNGDKAVVFARSEVSLVRQGVVRDFLKCVWTFPAWVPRLAGRDVWPWVFNVADAALVAGVILLLLHVLFDRKHPAGQAASD